MDICIGIFGDNPIHIVISGKTLEKGKQCIIPIGGNQNVADGMIFFFYAVLQQFHKVAAALLQINAGQHAGQSQLVVCTVTCAEGWLCAGENIIGIGVQADINRIIDKNAAYRVCNIDCMLRQSIGLRFHIRGEI